MIRISDERIQEYVRLYEEGWTYKQIGEKFGLKRNTVNSLLKRKGLLNSRSLSESMNPICTDELKQKVVAAYKFGMTSIQVAEKFNICSASVLKYVKESGINPRSHQESSKRSWGKPELAAEYYRFYETGMTLTGIAEIYGVSHSAVRELLVHHGYKLRSRTEAIRLHYNPKPPITAILPAVKPKTKPQSKPNQKPAEPKRSKNMELLDKLIAEERAKQLATIK